MKKNNLFKKVTSFILSISMLLAFSVPSYADRPNPGTDPGVGGVIGGEIIETKLGSIEISKTATDGKTPIDGVEFSYVKVADMIQESGTVHSIKFKLNEVGRTAFPAIADPASDYIVTGKVLNDYVKNGGVSNITYPSTQKGETVNGKVTFRNLPIGVYLIEETNVDNATIDGKKVQISKGVGPFLVSIPQTSPDGTKWEYDIKVDAKNIVDEETITKSVEGEDVVLTTDKKGIDVYTAGIGSTMWYTVTGSASKVIEESIYTQYEIEDMITSSLRYGEKGDSEATFLSKVEVYLDGTQASNKLNAADYVITTKKSTTTGRFAGFNVSLTASGLEKLNNIAMVDVTTVAIKYPVHMTEAVLEIEAVNTAKIKYTHKGGNPGEKETELEVFPLAIEVEKLFDNISVEDLPEGSEIDPTKVKFTIDKKGEPNKPIYVKKTESYEHGFVYIADLTVTQEGNGFTRLFNISEKGTAIVLGLPKGTYIITEIATVDGYSLLKEAIEVTIDKDQQITSKMVPVEGKLEVMALSSIDESNFAQVITDADVSYSPDNLNPLNTNLLPVEHSSDFNKQTNILNRGFYVNGEGLTVTDSIFKVIINDPVQTFKPETLKIEKGTIVKDGIYTSMINPVDVTNQFRDKITFNSKGFELQLDVTPTEQYKISYISEINFGPQGAPIKGNFYDKNDWVGKGINLSGINSIVFFFHDRIFGSIKLIKVDADNPTVTLPGAYFDLYSYGSNTAIKRYSTTASGEILIDNLQYGYYYLKEVTPPTGYKLSSERLDFFINENNYTEVQTFKFTNTREESVDPIDVERPFVDISKLTINNEKSPAFELPSTGGVGTFVYTITGLLLVSAAALVYITLNKNNR